MRGSTTSSRSGAMTNWRLYEVADAIPLGATVIAPDAFAVDGAGRHEVAIEYSPYFSVIEGEGRIGEGEGGLTVVESESGRVVIKARLVVRVDAEELLELRDRLGGVAVEDRGHPDRLGSGAVLAQVVDEDRGLGLDLEPLAGEQVDLRLRLVEADLAGDHRRVEEVGRGPVVDPKAPRVRDQAGELARGLGRPHRADHRLLRSEAGEHPRNQALVVGDPEQLGEAALELGVGHLAGLEPRAVARAPRNRRETRPAPLRARGPRPRRRRRTPARRWSSARRRSRRSGP